MEALVGNWLLAWAIVRRETDMRPVSSVRLHSRIHCVTQMLTGWPVYSAGAHQTP